MSQVTRARVAGCALWLALLACALPAPSSPTALLPTPSGRTPTPTPSLDSTPQATFSAASPSAPEIEDGPPAPTRGAPEAADASHFRGGQDVTLTEIRMVTRVGGWGLAGAFVLKTEDGGQTWREVTPPSPSARAETGRAYGAFLDLQNAWVVFAESDRISPWAVIWNTVDGGNTWSAIEIAQEAFGDLMWAEFFALDPTRAWVIFRGVYVGAGTHFTASLLRTTDGGASWDRIPSDLNYDLNYDYTGFAFADSENGWMTWQTTGPYAPAPPEFAVTRDGGLTWDVSELPPPESARTVFEDNEYSEPYGLNLLSAASLRLLVGSFKSEFAPTEFLGFLYATDDGGSSWTTYELPAGVNPSEDELIFFDPNHALLLGRTMYRTGDGGRTWERVKTVAWDGQFSFIDSHVGWAIARSGEAVALVKTINGGATWAELHPLAAR